MGNEDIVCKNKCCPSDDLACIEHGKVATDSSEKDDSEKSRVNFVQILPTELVDEILQYLGPSDLAAAASVSSEWREAVNSNKVWGQLCEKKGWKEDYDPNLSYFHRSHKQFRRWAHSNDLFSPMCQKRLLYNKHSYLLHNWRCGKYIVHKIGSHYSKTFFQLFEPVTCDGKYLVMVECQKLNQNPILTVWGLDRVPSRLCELELPSNIEPVDAIAFDYDTIVVIQDWQIVVYKLVDQQFESAYVIDDLKVLAPACKLSQMKRITPILKVTQESIICIPNYSHSTVDFLPIFFWDRESGELKSKLNFDSMYYQVISAVWLGESCYLAMTNKKSKSHQIVEFGIKSANWEYFSQSVSGVIEQITGNDQYILAVTKTTSREREYFRFENSSKELCLWDRVTGSSLKKFKANGKCFQFVDNYLIFFDADHLTVMNPREPNIRNEFQVSGTISSIKACSHVSTFVVIKTGCHIEVWDWGIGIRLYTVTTETGYGNQVWCDDRRIITYHSSDREDGCGIMVLGFW